MRKRIGRDVGKGGRIRTGVEQTYRVRVRCFDLREGKREGVVWAISDARDKDICQAAIQHIQRVAGMPGSPWKDTARSQMVDPPSTIC